ncbi:hypothetical protein GCM10027093_74040 [Paraburkholderia jirisanensis]
MNLAQQDERTERYEKCIEASRRVRWDIDRDVIRNRSLDPSHKFMPDGLSRADRLTFLNPDEQRMLSQIQGRTYANMFRLVERFIGAKMLEIGRDHALGDQIALEAIVRVTDEELKHQELFRRMDRLAAAAMPDGYRFLPDPDEVATVILGKSTWSVLALTCHIEIFSQIHYRQSIAADEQLSPLYKDVFLYHWKEESQHALIDELEWEREDGRIDDAARDSAVDDLIALVGAVDGVVQIQAQADTEYFVGRLESALSADEQKAIAAGILAAYRWQYIASGVLEPRFANRLKSLITDRQMARINEALGPIMASV